MNALAERIDETMASEITTDQLDDLVATAAGPILEKVKDSVVGKLRKRQPRMIRQHRRYEKGFERRLRGYWANALDTFYAITVCAEESGSDFNSLHRAEAVASKDYVFDALSGLHARACRIAFEVHQLLTSGFPMAALARSRTLHEVAVTSTILADYGRNPRFPDLGEKYILHDGILNLSDAREYQKYCASLGIEGIEDWKFAEIQQARDALVEKFGKSFKEVNGWAAEVTGNPNPGIVDLERLAELSHFRAYYKWANHEVHADSKGWRLNHGERAGIRYLSSGRMNFGLSEPGQMALGFLNICTVSFLMCIRPITFETILRLLAIGQLIDDAQESFAEGERMLDEAEGLRRHRIITGLH